MKLSVQALSALMMALQKSLMEQTDIVPVLQDFNFEAQGDELVVLNPPTVNVGEFLERAKEEAADEQLELFKK